MSECGTAVWENPGSSVYLWGMEYISTSMCFPGGSDGKESTCNAGDLGLIPVGKIPWRRERLPTPLFWPGKFHGLSPRGHKVLDMTERLHFHNSAALLPETLKSNIQQLNYFPEFRPFFDLPIKDYCKIGFIVSLRLLVSIFAFFKGRLSQTLIPWVIEISG